MKYEDVEDSVVELFNKVRTDYNFSDISDAKFKLVYRNNRKGKKQFIVIAEICATNDMIRFLTSDKIEEGYDYIIIIDKNIFNALDENDKIRVLRHELRHTDVVVNEKSGKIIYTTQRHSIEDFYEDVTIESQAGGDMRWKERLSSIAESIYEELDEKKKQEKKSKKK